MKVTSHSTLVVGRPGKAEDIPPGTPVNIDDEEARDLIARGIAVKVGKAETKPAEPQGSEPPIDPDAGKQP